MYFNALQVGSGEFGCFGVLVEVASYNRIRKRKLETAGSRGGDFPKRPSFVEPAALSSVV